MPALYSAPLPNFIDASAEQLLGALTSGLARQGFDTTTLTTFSWEREIIEMQEALDQVLRTLPRASLWTVLLEYILPVIGQRVDCVLLADDLIYVIEYKGGSSVTARAALQRHRTMP